MSRFVILLGGDFFRTPRVEAQVAGAARHRRRQRHPPRDDAWRPAGAMDRRFRFGIRRTRGGMAGCAARGLPVRQGQDRRRARRPGGDCQGRDLARAGRRIWRSACRSRLPASGAGAAACRARLADAAHQWSAGRPAAAAGRNQISTLRRGTLFSVLGFSDLTGLSVIGARWPLDRITMAFGSSLTISNEVAGDLTVAIGTGRALLVAHPYPSDSDF